MKKVALALATVAAATVFAPEASAVPVFARQTGMACSACHFQHFPLLNGFGRAFKSAGFTMMGAQGKVEATEGVTLDIPDRLNMGVLTSAYWQDESGGERGANAGVAPNSQARYGVPGSGGELSLFYGGRVADFGGFLSELGAAGAAATGAAKLALLFPVADMRAGVVLYTGGQGAAYGFETLNTGAADTHKMMGNAGPTKQHVAAAYAASYLGTRTDATGANVVVNNEMGFISIGQFAVAAPGTGNANDLPLTYARAVMNLDLAGFDVGVGLQHFHGDQSGLGAPGVSYVANIIDAQAQGEIAGMETGIYVGYGTAPANAGGNALAAGWSSLVKAQPVTAAGTESFGRNADGTLNGQVIAGAAATDANITQANLAASTLNVAASVEFMHGATVQAAMRMATLDYGSMVGGKSYSDNAYMIGATYDIAQNVALGLNYTVQSGTAWDEYKTATGVDAIGKTTTTFLLEALF